MLWVLTRCALADPTPPADPVDPAAQAHHLRTEGELGVVGGIVGFGGGIAVLRVGRGRSDQLSDESPTESDVRGITGGLLMVSGLTAVLIGGHALSQAKAWQEEADRHVALWIAPTPRGAVLGLEGRL